MQKRDQVALGASMIGLGALLLLGLLLRVNVWGILWPVGCIALGLWLLLRPRDGAANQTFLLLGEAQRREEWTVKDEEFVTGVADLDLDFTQADLAPGETRLRVYGLINDIHLLLPKTLGLRLHAGAIIMESEIYGRESERFFSLLEYASDNLETAEACLRLDITSFICQIKVRRF